LTAIFTAGIEEFHISRARLEAQDVQGRRSAMNLMNRLGFRPAFLDFATMTIYPSELAARVMGARATLLPGYERNGFFYTRTAAARATVEWTPVRMLTAGSPRH
jgi:hypothetical protein